MLVWIPLLVMWLCRRMGVGMVLVLVLVVPMIVGVLHLRVNRR